MVSTDPLPGPSLSTVIVPPVLADNAKCDGHSQAGSMSVATASKEGLEQVVLYVIGHATAVVRDH